MGAGVAKALQIAHAIAVRQGLPFRLVFGTFHKSVVEFQMPNAHGSVDESKNASTDPIEAQALTVDGERAK